MSFLMINILMFSTLMTLYYEMFEITKEVVKEIPPKKIQRIVVYYTDNTYEEFLS